MLHMMINMSDDRIDKIASNVDSGKDSKDGNINNQDHKNTIISMRIIITTIIKIMMVMILNNNYIISIEFVLDNKHFDAQIFWMDFSAQFTPLYFIYVLE